MYLVKTKVETISQNTVLQPEDFGGWQAVNLGTTVATVAGVPLDPNGPVIGQDFTRLEPNAIWSEPIRITFTGAGTNKVVITRLKYTEKQKQL